MHGSLIKNSQNGSIIDAFAHLKVMEITDFFERIDSYSQVEMSILRKYPNLFKYIMRFYYERDPEVFEGVMEVITKSLSLGMTMTLEGVDRTKFKSDVNLEQLAIIAAFMHDPKVLVLDEPTSGLDPLMQKRFVELIKDEKKKGKTILMSSHIFEEVEKTCDDVIIIRDGRIVHASDVASLSKASVVRYHVGVTDVDVARGVLLTDYAVTDAGDALEVMVPKEKVDAFVKTLAGMEILQLESKAQTLEDLFMQYYNKEVTQ